MRTLLLCCWSGLSKRLPNIQPLVVSQRWTVNPYCWIPYISETGPRGLWAIIDLNVPSLRTSIHGTRRHHKSFQRRQPIVLPSYDAHEPQQWPAQHLNLKSAVVACITWQQPTALSLDLWPFCRRETMPGSGNLANFSVPRELMNESLSENL